MKFNALLNNFSSGEWSPKMRSRAETEQYVKSCKTLKNFIPFIQGGAFRRQGTQYINIGATAKGKLTFKTKLIPWNTSDGGEYILNANDGDFTHWYVYDINAATSTAITTAETLGISFPKNLHYCQIGDLVEFVASSQDTSGTGLRREEPFILYKSGSAFKIKRLYSYITTETTLNGWEAYPYREPEALGSSVNMTPGATTGATTLTASAAFFNILHVGALFKLTSAGQTGACIVTGFTSTTVVSITILQAFTATTTVGTASGTSWEESAWSNYRGWPLSVAAFEGRICYGGNYSQPDTLWGSRIGNVFNLMEIPFVQDPEFTSYTQDNSRPFTLSPSSVEVSNIQAISSGKTLSIHTDKYEITASGSNGAMGPNDVQFESSTSYGADPIQPARVSGFLTFVQRTGRRLRDILFNFQEDQYKSNDLSFVADHLFYEGGTDVLKPFVAEMATVRFDQILWFLTSLGTSGATIRLFGVTLDRDYQVNGFFRFETGTTANPANVYAICAGGKNHDDLYMVVSRSPNADGSSAVLNLEKLPRGSFEYDSWTSTATTYKGPRYADFSQSSANASPQTTWSGYGHLTGCTVQVIADGMYIGTQVVSGGNILTPAGASNIFVGIQYTSLLQTNPLQLGQAVPNSPVGFLRRIDQVLISFWKTYGAKYGASTDDLYPIDFKDPTAVQTAAPVMFTGAKDLLQPGAYNDEVSVVIQQEDPWPCNLTSIACRGVLYD